MIKSNYLSAIAIVIAMCLAIGCKKTDDDMTPADKHVMPIVLKKNCVIDLPKELHSPQDPNAQMCSNFVDQVNTLADFLLHYQPPYDAKIVEGKSSNDLPTYMWFRDGMHFYLTITETETEYFWTLDIEKSNISRRNYVVTQEKKDGSAGDTRVYNIINPIANQLESSFDWKVDAKGVLEISMVSGVLNYDAIAATNYTGQIKYSVNNTLLYNMTWDANGNGTWEFYDYGKMMDNGKWEE